MSKIGIKVENLSKAYQIGEFSTGTISQDIERWWITKIKGKEDPFLKIGESNDRTIKGKSNVVWSLKDLNFEIQQGDSVGIIGKNGAGKSTLLKLLSRVTIPTLGSIKAKGRIASLLEVGTGFHPELTGRENVFLNGAILGMRKHEIKSKLDQIIDFSGVERYIDTPVKRYSSGMYVRLAFAVAAHLESEILIVDEVLAVGDADFQKRCLGKMGEISKGEGRTILFVSHNMTSVMSLCNNGIVLDQGKVLFQGSSVECVDFYSKNRIENFNHKTIHFDYTSSIKIENLSFYFFKSLIYSGEILPIGENISLLLEIKALKNIVDFSVVLEIKNLNNELISHISNEDDNFLIERLNQNESIKFLVEIEKLFLTPGTYSIDVWIGSAHRDSHYLIEDAFFFNIVQNGNLNRSRELPKNMKVFMKSNWTLT